MDSKLKLSDDNKKVEYVREDHPGGFNESHLLCTNGVTGRCYWEVPWFEGVDVSVGYRGENGQTWSLCCSEYGKYSVRDNIGITSIPFSHTSLPFPFSSTTVMLLRLVFFILLIFYVYIFLVCFLLCSLDIATLFLLPLSPVFFLVLFLLLYHSLFFKVGVYVDWPAGTVSFYQLHFNTVIHIHNFNTTFTEPLYPKFSSHSLFSLVSLKRILFGWNQSSLFTVNLHSHVSDSDFVDQHFMIYSWNNLEEFLTFLNAFNKLSESERISASPYWSFHQKANKHKQVKSFYFTNWSCSERRGDMKCSYGSKNKKALIL